MADEGLERGQALFRKEGEYWTIALDQHLVRLRDAKGLRYIAALLRRPRTRIHSADLTGHNPMPRPEAISSERLDESAQRATPSAERERLKVTQRIKATLRKIAQ